MTHQQLAEARESHSETDNESGETKLKKKYQTNSEPFNHYIFFRNFHPKLKIVKTLVQKKNLLLNFDIIQAFAVYKEIGNDLQVLEGSGAELAKSWSQIRNILIRKNSGSRYRYRTGVPICIKVDKS